MQQAEELLRKGANPNLTDEKGCTPLHVICDGRGDEDVQNDEGNTPLHGAAINNKPKVVKLLLKNGSNPNLANKNGETPLHNICKRVRIKEVSVTLLRTPSVLIDLKNRMKAAKSLLRRGANPNLVDKNGSTPLLILCNSVLENVDYLEDTKLRSASKEHEKKLVKLLLRKGADPNVANIKGLVPLHICVWRLDFNHNDVFAKKFFKICASGVLTVAERLTNRGYELKRNDTLVIMKLFAECQIFEKSVDCDKCWDDDENFSKTAERITVNKNLWLDELIKLRPEEAKKLVTYTDYFNIFREFIDIKPCQHFDYGHDCYLHLCEKLSRGFFRRWALDPFWELIHKRLPLECCEMVLKNLNNEDLYNICLTAAGQSS
uniref:Uncharacterized protein n=1 Tax=Trichogramma kaykai TaxID=54128 RepID=A0ABD2XIN3_9HYME